MLSIPMLQDQVVLIDDIDADLFNLHHWRVHKAVNKTATFYVQAHNKEKKPSTLHLHRLILGRILDRDLDKKEQVDHVNGNGLDNRRENLRLATGSQNQHNRGKYKNNTSGYKGVSWNKHTKRWRASIRINGKPVYLGDYHLVEDAYEAYKTAARKFHGEFARFE